LAAGVRDATESVEVKARAIEALVELRSFESATVIRPLLGSDYLDLQVQAARAMGTFGVADAVPDLVALLDSPDSWVSETALDALDAIAGPMAERAVTTFRAEHFDDWG